MGYNRRVETSTNNVMTYFSVVLIFGAKRNSFWKKRTRSWKVNFREDPERVEEGSERWI